MADKKQSSELTELKRQLAVKKEFVFSVNYEQYRREKIERFDVKPGEYVKYYLKSGGFLEFIQKQHPISNLTGYLDTFNNGRDLVSRFVRQTRSYAEPKFDMNPESVRIHVLDLIVFIKMTLNDYADQFKPYGPKWEILKISENPFNKFSGNYDYLHCTIVRDHSIVECEYVEKEIISKSLNDYKDEDDKKYSLASNFKILETINLMNDGGYMSDDDYREAYDLFFKMKWDIKSRDVSNIRDIRIIYQLIADNIKMPNRIIRQFDVKRSDTENFFVAINKADKYFRVLFTTEPKLYIESQIYRILGDDTDAIDDFITDGYISNDFRGSFAFYEEEICDILRAIHALPIV